MADRRAATTQEGLGGSASGEILPGDVIAGRYIVEESLGAGGMGVVVAARHEALGHRVAIKFLATPDVADADAFIRFSREAKIIASLESEHVVRVVDYGMHVGRPYMVMELLDGRDLGKELERRGEMPIEEVVDDVIEACEGLWAAHAKGIVHRDVKPANLFVAVRADGERVIKVLDFGVSKLQIEHHDAIDLTHTTTMIGSPQYMSPEQIRDPRLVDARADLWSLGVVLYRLLARQAPFTGHNATAVCAAIVADAPIPLQACAPRVPSGLAAIVMRCLEKQPEKRPANVAVLAQGLAAFASPRGRAEAARLAARANLPAASPRRRSPARWIGASLALVGAVVIAYVATRAPATSTSASDTEPAAATSASTRRTEPATATSASRGTESVAARSTSTGGAQPAAAPSARVSPTAALPSEPRGEPQPAVVASEARAPAPAKSAPPRKRRPRQPPATPAPSTPAPAAPAAPPAPSAARFGGTALDVHN